MAMKLLKHMLLLGVALGLSACELAPVADTSDQDQYIQPLPSTHGSSLGSRLNFDGYSPRVQPVSQLRSYLHGETGASPDIGTMLSTFGALP